MAELQKGDIPPLPRRPNDGHKGTFGTVCVLGGQCASPRMMIGGPALSATAALRTGCGLAVLALPEPILPHGLVIAPSATGLSLPIDSAGRVQPSEVAALLDDVLNGFSCLAIGPGFGDGDAQQQIMVPLVAQEDVPLVIDADGLNALSKLRDFSGDFRCHAVLTPHPGEYRRLASGLGLDRDPTSDEEREQAAIELAQRLGCVVVLKGRRTIVADGIQTWLNETGNVSLATAGTGDVLTGVIAGLVAQFHKPHLGMGTRQITPEQQGGLSLFDCARIAVYVHGIAADRWSERHGEAGLIASDLLTEIPGVIRDLPRNGDR